jgi:hypothetical protein
MHRSYFLLYVMYVSQPTSKVPFRYIVQLFLDAMASRFCAPLVDTEGFDFVLFCFFNVPSKWIKTDLKCSSLKYV